MGNSTCERCCFFDRAQDYRGEPNDYGTCRKNPPSVVPVTDDGKLLADPIYGVWPRVLPSNWCGAFQTAKPRAKCWPND